MSLAKGGWDDQLGNVLAEHVLFSTAERVLCGVVEVENDALRVDGDDGVERGVEHGLQKRGRPVGVACIGHLPVTLRGEIERFNGAMPDGGRAVILHHSRRDVAFVSLRGEAREHVTPFGYVFDAQSANRRGGSPSQQD